ncbi:DNA starvation/stationary phase protection protein [Paenibacillus sp. JNUCC32]|uniref:Dps family protein n=1 Tax=Paenibacillus TaxID=44249 RepID=UPI000BBDDA48|nr:MULTISPECIES: DNA starvation/stationary phase protection protein [Paenibacillus]PCL92249.1 DNA starvation/stationary phase protection protein [Paenibacillus lautus]QOT08126.1 DNA starvation/stationary phase protection protein [Paenibacillus sp. JNUCC-32]GIP06726.1 DNA starvation/stationary phase protection protein [Paenibacillus lautus]
MSNLTQQAQGNTTDELQQILNTQVANWSVLGVKLHHYHWYVKGPQFYVLHEKFEELYNAAAGYVDELAERMLAIGGKPAASMAQYLKLTTLQEVSNENTAEQMVGQLVADFEKVAGELKSGIEAANQEGDDATADLLTGMASAVQKHSWMLNAFLGK